MSWLQKFDKVHRSGVKTKPPGKPGAMVMSAGKVERVEDSNTQELLMTGESLALKTLLGKASDGNFLRQSLEIILHLLMEEDVSGKI